jgi:phosphatidate cytidylyltransferase
MVALVAGLLVWGQVPTLIFLLIMGLIGIDEIYHNFLKRKRSDFWYIATQVGFAAVFCFLHLIDRSPGFALGVTNVAALLNIALLVYLFNVEMESHVLLRFTQRYPLALALPIALPMLSLAGLVHQPEWRKVLAALMFVNFGMDTGAWFVGKNFGAHKLWQSVSPKKTIEGLVGGAVIAALVGSLYWHFAFGNLNVGLIIFLGLLGILSQLGDLVQSKMKRQFGLKDSSALIPGHGGVYDRIDSLLFLAPFYALALATFGQR